MKILAITQARIGSTRFPEKILKTINGESLLEIHLKRAKQSKLISKLKVATTTEQDADKIVNVANLLGVDVYKGSVDNVLERFYQAAIPEAPDWIVRLTSDCPLIDAQLIDKVIEHALNNNLDYVSNTLKPTYPDGFDVEVFRFEALKRAMSEHTLKSESEHVTPYIWKNSTYMGGNKFKSDCLLNDTDYSELRITVDTKEDYEMIKKLIELFGSEKTWFDYTKSLIENPEIRKINQQYSRNEGYEKSVNNDKTQ